jgi:hypothetical protein
VFSSAFLSHQTDTFISFLGLTTSSDWIVNTSPHRILGDDEEGPHSTAIIVGRRTVIACAHSLGLLVDKTKKSSRTTSYCVYQEDYWIQPSFTKNVKGEFTDDNRIPLKLSKFNVDNDWAVFVRADKEFFADDEIASIDLSPILQPLRVLVHKQAIVLHCPVSLKAGITKAKEYSLGCQIASVRIQSQSTHHVKYEGRDFCRGSSGGGIYVQNSTSVLGMHIEAINEADYDGEENKKVVIAPTDKRVDSEDSPYELIETTDPPAAKKMKCESDTVASIAGGNNGLGSAIIICKFPRLMHYIREQEK